MLIFRTIFPLALWMAASQAVAQAPAVEPRNIVTLSATASQEVAQDLLSVTLSVAREGAEAAQVQTQLRQVLDASLNEVRKTAATGQMDVRTGAFSLQPRYGRDGKFSGWVGSAELVLEGRDFERIGAAVGKASGMTVANVGFGLSREARQALESQIQSQAAERFKAKAADLARSFGFSGYSLREVTVSGGGAEGTFPRPRVYAMAAKASMADAPLPLEGGKSVVEITVAGSVQLMK